MLPNRCMNPPCRNIDVSRSMPCAARRPEPVLEHEQVVGGDLANRFGDRHVRRQRVADRRHGTGQPGIQRA